MTRRWPALALAFPAPQPSTTPDPTLQDLVSAELDGLDIVAVAEQPDGSWQVYFKDDAQRAAAAAVLRAAHGPGGLILCALDVPDEDWARRNQEALRAVRIGGIIVAPPWDVPSTPATGGAMTIVIDPAMGFGSGHHATTRLCLAALQRLDLQGLRVLDIGTGSGVLALTAVRLGAAAVLGIDTDRDALDNARGNAALNDAPSCLEFRELDFRQEPSLIADVVVANLTGGMLTAGRGDVVRKVAPGGSLILSGISLDERQGVLAAFAESCTVRWTAEEDGWCCVLFHRER